MAIIGKRNEMPVQDAIIRAHNFKEVALGYNEEMAISEASRCLNCKNRPCVSACPVNIDIPSFISKIKEKKYEEAYQIIALSSSLPAICGRVCPQESQCESKCTLGIKFEAVAIGRLERYVADLHNQKEDIEQEIKIKNNHKVAIIGSGPSGLACASDLAKFGYDVTIYEALHKAGGVLVYGIPEFRLPKMIVEKEINNLNLLGVKIETNVVIGKTLTISELFDLGYDAIYIATGAGLPNFMNIKGESLKGVFSANEFLTRSNLMKAYVDSPITPIMKGGVVAVVGGGNVAMDACRTALRLGASKVYIIYRRSMEEMPARKEEIEHAIEEGIEFKILTNPIEIIGYNNENDKFDPKNGFVSQIKCIKMELGAPDEKGRRRPIPIPNSEFCLDVDTVIMAIGTSPNPLIKSTTNGLDTNSRGCIITDDDLKTSIEGIYAGGDAVTGAATVISAMGAGKKAAKSIDEYIRNK